MIADLNAAAEALLGASQDALSRQAICETMFFDDNRLADALNDAEADISVRSAACRVKGMDAPLTIDLSLSPIPDWPGWRVAAMIPTYAPDGIASHVAAEDLDKTLRGPDILAHEIKNPLAGIRGAAQLLGRQQHTDGAGRGDASLVKLIAEEVDRIAELIDRMQFRGRAIAGPLEPVNFHEILGKVKMLCLAEHGRKITILEKYDPSLPEIMASAPALTQILHNLVSNAADACADQPDPTITLSSHFAAGLRIQNKKGTEMVRLPVEIRISDNGAGVSEAIRPHLFTPFVTSKTHGQGLGLAVVRQLVIQMQGRVVYRRHKNRQQSQFRLFLPAAKYEDTVL